MLLKSAFLYLLISAIVPAYSQPMNSGSNSSSMNTITRQDYSIACPDSWRVDSTGSMGADLFLFSLMTDGDDFNENMNVFIQPLTGQGYDVERMGKESEAQIRLIITSVEILESRVIEASPYPYYFIKYNGQHGVYQLITEQRYFLHNDIGYALTFTFKKGTEDEFREVANEIFNSFRFH